MVISYFGETGRTEVRYCLVAPDNTWLRTKFIDHGTSLATMYAHLSRVFVSVGQRVSTLQAVAASGNTGWSTGPHLHFQVDLQGTPVNPLSWL